MIRWLASLLLLCSPLTAETVDELKAAISDTLPEIHGWCSQERAMRFFDHVLETKPQVCVEIGVFCGASLLPTAAALRWLGQGTIIAIDPWDKIECIRYLDPDEDTKALRWWTHLNMDHMYFGFLNVLRQFDLEKCCVIMRSTSRKAATAVGPIDLLHLDGNHHPPVVLEDVLLYLPKVRSGGYVWFNDASWSSLKPALDELLKACDLVDSVDKGNCVLLRKR